jgi:hypothetical protein
MTPDPTTHATERPDDAVIAAAVREIVDDWRLPPQGIDDRTWRDRVDVSRSRRRTSMLGRLAAAAGVAVVLTASLAFGAVWLQGAGRVGKPGPSGIGPSAAAPTASAGSGAASPLPKLATFGAPPSVTSVLIDDGGAYRLADLTTGDVSGALFPGHDVRYAVLPTPDGGWLCVCGDWAARGPQDEPIAVTVTLLAIGADGTPTGSAPVREVTGVAQDQPAGYGQPSVDIHVSASPDGLHAFVGWTRYAGPGDGWRLGVDVVDLASVRVVASAEMTPSTPATVAGDPWARSAPAVSVSDDGAALVVTSSWYTFDTSAFAGGHAGASHWNGTYDGRRLSISAAVAFDTDMPSCAELDAGAIDAYFRYVVCDVNGATWIERRQPDGIAVDSRKVEASSALGLSFQRVGGVLFGWAPQARTVYRYDLATGELTSGEAPKPTASVGGDWAASLAALGRRIGSAIAPSALAKVRLDPAFAVSSDGSRLYALGVGEGTDEEALGSTGVFVFDARTLQPVAHWAPTADFESIALSGDDRSVYAAARAGFGADGKYSGGRASISVFDAADGSIRTIAGEVATTDIWFPATPLR